MSFNDGNGEVDLRAQLVKMRQNLEIYQLKRQVEQLRESFTKMMAGRNVARREPVWEERVVSHPLDAYYDNREVYQNHYWGGYSVDNPPYVPNYPYYSESSCFNPMEPQQSSYGYAENHVSAEELEREAREAELRRMLERMNNSLYNNPNNQRWEDHSRAINTPGEPFSPEIGTQWGETAPQVSLAAPQEDNLYEMLEHAARGMDRTDHHMQEMKESAERVEIHLNQIALAREEQRTQPQFLEDEEAPPEDTLSTDNQHEYELSTEESPETAQTPDKDCEELLEEDEPLRVEEEEWKHEEMIEDIEHEASSSSSNHEPSHLSSESEPSEEDSCSTIFEEERTDPQPVDVFEGEDMEEDSRPTRLYDESISAEREAEYVKIFPDEFLHRSGEPAVARIGGRGSCVVPDKAQEFLDDGRRLQFDGWPVQWEPWK